ncbi:MAG: hypothetical protein IJ341_03610 [Bacteroidales bacterium]|nr:hypothetical protein [Bacteroidales bacterium]MBQ7818767.1 hypothetical protein [Bacteroidales bacterium]
MEQDTLFLSSNEVIVEIDTADIVTVMPDTTKVWAPDPIKSLWYSALMPGAGQIYNRKYWKLPIIVGGFMGLAYGISFNSRYYTDYSNAYRDAYSSDPNANSYINFLPYSYRNNKEWIEKNKEWIRSSLKSRKDYYRRNRDLCIVGMLAVYGLAIIDAYVDAQLYNFDISPDVSLKLSPAVLEPSTESRTPSVLGFQCALTF